MENFTMIVLGIGLLLMLAELVIPGGVTFCAGLSLLVVGLFYEMDWERNYLMLGLLWCFTTVITSFISIFVLSKFIASDSTEEIVEEDDGMVGSHVQVTEDVNSKEGRVNYRGTSWKAVSSKGTLKQGDIVTVVAKEDLTLVVEESEEDIYENLKEE